MRQHLRHGVAYPSLSDEGLIEAGLSSVEPRSVALRYPSLSDEGLIEVSSSAPCSFKRWGYPSLSDEGLIEVRRARVRCGRFAMRLSLVV